jgi:hypothetical protein
LVEGFEVDFPAAFFWTKARFTATGDGKLQVARGVTVSTFGISTALPGFQSEIACRSALSASLFRVAPAGSSKGGLRTTTVWIGTTRQAWIKPGPSEVIQRLAQSMFSGSMVLKPGPAA